MLKESEDLDREPWEPLDFGPESSRYPHKTPHQREVCRRAKAQDTVLKNAVLLEPGYKGNR